MLSGVRSRNAAPARGMLGRRSGCVINGPRTIHLFAANADWSKATLPKGSFRDSMELLQHAPPIRRSLRDIMLRLRGGLRGQRMIQRILLSVAAALATVAMVGTAASAHPHVWVTIKSELVYTPDGSVTGVRQAWTFDDMFSAFALQGIEAKKKGEFTREELAPLAEVNVSSLKEYEYFTYATANGKKLEFVDPPTGYYLDVDQKEAVLTLHFLLPLKHPLKAKNLTVAVYDPEYFIDFSLADKEPAKLVGAPAQCKLTIGKPQEMNAALAQQFSQLAAGQRDPTLTIGAEYADKLLVKCP
jgi:ABC-type uncharacterized transport system substrate-binding protein